MLHAVSNNADDSWGDDYTREIYTDAEFDGIGDEDNNGLNSAAKEYNQMQALSSSPPNGLINAEHILLHLSSHMGHTWCNTNAAEDLAKGELHLWEGQLNDSLYHIHIALGHKYYLFRNNIHLAYIQRLKTCAWGEVHAVKSTV